MIAAIVIPAFDLRAALRLRPSLQAKPAALAPLPVEALRLDPMTAAGLRRVGLRRIAELTPMPRDALARRFGEQVARRLDQALGGGDRPGRFTGKD